MNRRASIWLTVILGLGAVLAVSAWILRAVMEVRNNRGADTYINAQGMQVHWVDVLTMWAAAALAILVTLVATAIFKWRRRNNLTLVEKLGARIGTERSDQDK
jgi:cytochrome bd-type quinol oxidase subunit 2